MATVVAFHAHPDDEVLLTGGTLARLAAEGNRVIIAIATDGIVGSAAGQDRQARLAELRESAAVLGAAGGAPGVCRQRAWTGPLSRSAGKGAVRPGGRGRSCREAGQPDPC